MQRLAKNQAGYRGETIDLVDVLRNIEITAEAHGWRSEDFLHLGSLRLLALHRASFPRRNPHGLRVYLFTGIHGDEPAGPLAALRLLQQNR